MITTFFSPKRNRGGAAPSSASDTQSGEESRDRAAVNPSPPSPADGDSNERTSNKRLRTGEDDATPGPAASSSVAPSVDVSISEAEELLSHLVAEGGGDETGGGGGKLWRQALRRHLSSPQFASLAKFVASERKSKTIYPPPNDTFSAMNLTPLSEVKVVVVGQDPYHGPGQGHGLAFSVQHGMAIPPSLRNIYKELLNDDAVPDFSTKPTHGYLERWARQGVLMLNSVLTVRKSDANSHAKKGWENFTDEVIRAVDRESGPKGVVFLLWGKPASKKAESVVRRGGRHTVICTSHPSPLGATKTKSPFLGSRCFSRANDALVERGMDPIDWNVDGPLDNTTESDV